MSRTRVSHREGKQRLSLTRDIVLTDEFLKDLSAQEAAKAPHLLGQIKATCIAGNDILGSVFYTIGSTGSIAAVFAPISLTLVAFILYFFRSILSEVGYLIPKNGGTYQTMLNCSTPMLALFAGICSILSYIATAVVSAASMATYAASESSKLNVYWLTIVVIVTIALFNLLGVRESAVVAAAIFIAHFVCLLILMGACIRHIILYSKGDVLEQAYEIYRSERSSSQIVYDVFVAYCVGMLGVTGFEASSNYIEEQAPGVYPKTLRNMWYLTSFINPTLCLLCLMVVPYDDFKTNTANVLSIAANIAGGTWLRLLIVVDACVVLAGGVLTAFVGVSGVIDRLASEQFLPIWLLKRNKRTGSPDAIIVGFCVLSILLYLIVNGDLAVLGGMFAMSFLLVLGFFGASNFFFRLRRARMVRVVRSSFKGLVIGMLGVFAAFLGNVIYSSVIIADFLLFFVIVGILVVASIYWKGIWFIMTKLRKHIEDSETRDRTGLMSSLSSHSDLKSASKPMAPSPSVPDGMYSMRPSDQNVDANALAAQAEMARLGVTVVPPPPPAARRVSDIVHVNRSRRRFRRNSATSSSSSSDDEVNVMSGSMTTSSLNRAPSFQVRKPSREISVGTDSGSDTSTNSSQYFSEDELETLGQSLILVNEEDPKMLENLGLTREKFPVIFLLSTASVRHLWRAMTYCHDYAGAQRVYVVHFCDGRHLLSECPVKTMFIRNQLSLHSVYPHMIMDLIILGNNFSPASLSAVSRMLQVRSNFVFMRAPGPNFEHKLAEFSDFRIIV